LRYFYYIFITLRILLFICSLMPNCFYKYWCMQQLCQPTRQSYYLINNFTTCKRTTTTRREEIMMNFKALRSGLVILAASALLLAAGSAGAATDGIAVLQDFQGKIMLKSGGGWGTAVKGMRLYSGDKVVTQDGTATVKFDDGASLRVDPFSNIGVIERSEERGLFVKKQVNARRIRVLLGRTTYEEQPVKGRETAIEMPTAVAALRGTAGTFGYDGANSAGQLTSGDMEVEGAMQESIPRFGSAAQAASSPSFQAAVRAVELSLASQSQITLINVTVLNLSQREQAALAASASQIAAYQVPSHVPLEMAALAASASQIAAAQANVAATLAEALVMSKNPVATVVQAAQETIAAGQKAIQELDVKQQLVTQATNIVQKAEGQKATAAPEMAKALAQTVTAAVRASTVAAASSAANVNVVEANSKGDKAGVVLAEQAKKQSEKVADAATQTVQVAGKIAAAAAQAVTTAQQQTVAAAAQATGKAADTAVAAATTTAAMNAAVGKSDTVTAAKNEVVAAKAVQNVETSTKIIQVAGQASEAAIAAQSSTQANAAQQAAESAGAAAEATAKVVVLFSAANTAAEQGNTVAAEQLNQAAATAQTATAEVSQTMTSVATALDSGNAAEMEQAVQTLQTVTVKTETAATSVQEVVQQVQPVAVVEPVLGYSVPPPIVGGLPRPSIELPVVELPGVELPVIKLPVVERPVGDGPVIDGPVIVLPNDLDVPAVDNAEPIQASPGA
jgi:hypothetical protein